MSALLNGRDARVQLLGRFHNGDFKRKYGPLVTLSRAVQVIKRGHIIGWRFRATYTDYSGPDKDVRLTVWKRDGSVTEHHQS